LDKSIGIIIQARLTSKRFPNKMLCPLRGKPVLQWTIDAVKKSGLPFVIAIPQNKTDKGLAEWIKLHDPSIKVFTGHKEDLILRFQQVNEITKYDVIVRICGDNPNMDPEDIQLALELYKKRGHYSRVNHVEVFSNEELNYCADNDPFIERRQHCVNMLGNTVDYPEDIERLEENI
jgi:spore coat polysaccharide biosynthesis protein SpsF (cytidylyltransferase family)